MDVCNLLLTVLNISSEIRSIRLGSKNGAGAKPRKLPIAPVAAG